MSDYIILFYVLKYYSHQFIFFTICLSEQLLLYIITCYMHVVWLEFVFPKPNGHYEIGNPHLLDGLGSVVP